MLRHDVRGAPSGDDPTAELRELRLRAYGPDADIAADPGAQRRLQELEAREASASSPHRVAHPSEPVAVTEPAGVDRIPRADEGTAEPDDPLSTTSETPGDVRAEPTSTWRLSRRLVLTWVGSLAIVAIVAASVSWAVTRRIQADPQQIAVLGSHPDQRIPTVFGTDPQGKRFADFYGLTVIALQGRGWMGGAPEDYCLILMDSGSIRLDTNSYSGEMYGGCGAGMFPATVQVRVSEELPDSLRERFADGSALQFVLQGGEVVVLSDVPGD